MSEIVRTPSGALSQVTRVAGIDTHHNLTPGKGKCTFCKGPLDADADMVAEVCTTCWDGMFKEDEDE